MLAKQLELINEQTSPLFRIMWTHDVTVPTKRQFDNNICAFHIGNGLILSVAHNLRMEAGLFKSIDDASFQANILPQVSLALRPLFNTNYVLDGATHKRHINQLITQANVQSIVNELKRINYDTRWVTLGQRNICKPHLIIQFKNNSFYSEPTLSVHFNASNYMAEPTLNSHTYLLEVELVDAFYKEDIALYRIVNTNQDVINRLPKIDIDFSLLEETQNRLFCLQSAPNSPLGKLINKAQVEGFLENFNIMPDRIGGNYTFEGIRYLIKGYFRFGSSGAPYVYFDTESETFKVNAVQSEACPLQLAINGKQDGNFQYVNAIASPLKGIQDRLEAHMNPIPAQ